MRVLGRERLIECAKKHTASKVALDNWYQFAKQADWRKPQDIKDRFRSADFLANNRVIFNIKGNNFRLVVKVRYQNGIVVVEWVGTHAEYDKKQF